MKKTLTLFLIIISFNLTGFGQQNDPVLLAKNSINTSTNLPDSVNNTTGNLKGTIKDKNGTTIPGAYISIILANGEKKETITDFDGKYSFSKISSGKCKLIIEYVSYTTKVVELNVNIDNTHKVINRDFVLESKEAMLDNVVITAKAIRNDEVAILALQKNAVMVQDGISTQELSKLGVSNAAESVKQITGASVEDGKYVIIRGLGDRYSLTLLDGVILPSTNPYKNAASLDILPTGMIDNIITMKTFTPELPGNFAGGLVNVESKSMPDKFYLNVGASLGYNTNANLKDDFMSESSTSATDFLGYDDGSRNKPDILNQHNIKDLKVHLAKKDSESYADERAVLDESAKALSTPFTPQAISSLLNQGYSVSFGNALSFLNNKKFGYNFALDYGLDYESISDGKKGLFEDVDGKEKPLLSQQNLETKKDTKTASIGTMSKFAFVFNKNQEIGLTTIYNHEGSATSEQSNGFWRAATLGNIYLTELKWEERSVLSSQLYGKHLLPILNGASLKWTGGYTTTSMDQPDRRIFAFSQNEDKTASMSSSEQGTLPSHFYRELKDSQYNFKLDLEIPIGNGNNKIKVGSYYSNKDRVFDESRYTMLDTSKTASNPDYVHASDIINGDFSSFFSPTNAGVLNAPTTAGNNQYGLGNIYTETTLFGNSYTGSETIFATYLQGTFSFGKFSFTTGARLESTVLKAESKDTRKDKGNIDTFDILPALNTAYNINEKHKLRLAISQTVARPNIREIAPFEEYYIGNIIKGNPNLKRTKITNFDLRYEIYPNPSEIFSVSVFAKSFKDPIVKTLTVKTSNSEVVPQNVQNAMTYGTEFEFRKNLNFIHPLLHNFSFSTNLALVYSVTEKSDEEKQQLEEIQSKGDYTYITSTRPFQGQSPYIFNVALSHKQEQWEWTNTVSLNVFGNRLSATTDYLNPDVYETSRPLMNFISIKQFGNHWKTTLKIQNILNPAYSFIYDTSNAEVRNSYNKGIDFTLSIGYTF